MRKLFGPQKTATINASKPFKLNRNLRRWAGLTVENAPDVLVRTPKLSGKVCEPEILGQNLIPPCFVGSFYLSK